MAMPPGLEDVQIPVQVNPNEDTEWNDILRKHGIIPEKPKDIEPEIQQALLEAHQRMHDERLEDKTLDELDAHEDDEDEDFLASYRQKRMDEIKRLQSRAKFGQVYPIQKVDYGRDVTEASKEAWVLLLLTGAGVESKIAERLWPEIAARFADVRFCSIRAEMCIEGYPERNCPTILIYYAGEIQRQIVSLAEVGGTKCDLVEMQNLLVRVGAISEKDARLRTMDDEEGDHGQDVRRGLKNGATSLRDTEDDDWD
ncbi:hypothetical protein BT93_L1430 [Corymbia citriodora subsp. variegata]|uniref:Phosducin domain-containing protein n=1 Tax=Corymbia citriodora subsp. variegata TaxID=360336 RepID=A0A8T0CEF0_CORYI|nr:hypothetical protein BT93_L1430 [Corymbia citriodora subsp. variegata]